MKRILVAAGLVAVIAVLGWLTRDSAHQLLSDWTGEEDLQYQLRGLGYLALNAVEPAHDTADLTPMLNADVDPFGVNTFLEQEVEPSKIRQSLQMIHDAGFHFIRQEFPWEDIEKPGKGQYWDYKYNQSTWDKYDRIVQLAHEYGLEIIARLDHPPAWTRHDGRARGDFAPPDNYDDYGDFVAKVVSRYRGKIKYYQLWNEPNIYPEWGEQPANPIDFVRLLQIGYTRAKQADPNVVILSAGLAQTSQEGPMNVSDLVFLQEMYNAGARGYFDVLAVQDYGLFTGPGDRRLEFDRTNFSRPILIRELMVKNGDADKPIWAMEVGWNVAPANLTPTFGRVTLDQQARYAVQAYERAADEWPWMGVMAYWFFKRADDHEVGQPFYYFRLMNPDFSPEPVYASLKDYIAQARFVSIGFHSTSHWAIDWSGGWKSVADPQAYFGEYKVGVAGDSADLVFSGTDVDLVVKQNPYGGAVSASIDGQAPVNLDLWRTDPGAGGRIALARDLDDGEHHLHLVVTQGPAAIDGLIVQRGNAWQVRRLGGAGLVVGLALAGLILWRRKRAEGHS